MKFAAKGLSILAVAGLVMGAVMATPASAGGKRNCTLVSEIDSALTRLDHELFGWMKRKH